MAVERNLSVMILAASGVTFLLLYVLAGTLGSIHPIAGPILVATPLLLGLIGPAAAVAIYKYGYWMIPLFTRASRTIQTRDAAFEIIPSNDAITRRDGGTYYATMFLSVKLFKSATTMGDDEKVAFMDLWERSISGMKHVTKFCQLVFVRDLSKYRDGIEQRKAAAQMKATQLTDQGQVETTERQVAMWDNMLSKLDIGDKAMALMPFIQTTGAGATQDAALGSVRAQANEIRSTVGTALNAEVVPLTGEDMRRCFDWSLTMPTAIKA